MARNIRISYSFSVASTSSTLQIRNIFELAPMAYKLPLGLNATDLTACASSIIAIGEYFHIVSCEGTAFVESFVNEFVINEGISELLMLVLVFPTVSKQNNNYNI